MHYPHPRRVVSYEHATTHDTSTWHTSEESSGGSTRSFEPASPIPPDDRPGWKLVASVAGETGYGDTPVSFYWQRVSRVVLRWSACTKNEIAFLSRIASQGGMMPVQTSALSHDHGKVRIPLLVARGLLEVHRRDKRYKLYDLTTKGERYLAGLLKRITPPTTPLTTTPMTGLGGYAKPVIDDPTGG